MIIIDDFIIDNLTPDTTILSVGSRSQYHWWVKFNLENNRVYHSGDRKAWDTPSDDWIAQARNIVFNEFEKLKKQKIKKCFVRFGKPPADGQSYNYRDNHYEPGVSVYPAFIIGDEVRLVLKGIDFASYMFIAASGRNAYLVEGDIVGYGSDGEPCLNVTRSRKLHKKYSLNVA